MASQLDRDYQLLSDEFPRIAKALLLMRGYPESAVYVDKLLADNRDGSRTGFPPEVLEALLNIQLAHTKPGDDDVDTADPWGDGLGALR
jgi:hypothetical protein